MKKRIEYVPTPEECEDKAIYNKNWMIYVNIIMKKTSRRELLDAISLALVRRDIDIRYRGSELLFIYEDLDEIFDDPEMRWLSVFLSCKGTKLGPKHFSNKTMRLIMLMLYVKIEYPHLTHHIEHKH